MSTSTEARVYELLCRMYQEGLDAAQQLFWTELDYERASTPLSQRNWPDRARNSLKGKPILLAQHKTDSGSFDVIYARLSPAHRGRGFPLCLTAERLVVNQLLEEHPCALFVFSDTAEEVWHLVNVPQGKKATKPRLLRRITIGPDEHLGTAAERVALLALPTPSPFPGGLVPSDIQQRHDEAFRVETLIAQFFQDYRREFFRVRKDLCLQTSDDRWAHGYTLQFLNRLMFLYYVQRKHWLGGAPDFVSHFWQTYQQAGRPVDTFFSEWLSVLFFEVFNDRFQTGRAERRYLPQAIRDMLAQVPNVNGGLFRPNELDVRHQPQITDERMAQILAFLDGYNFTLSENRPLDQEVAVDPEMIGIVYESLLNAPEQVDERGAAGVFYTPRAEIDLMCRLSLVHWLANQLGEEHKSLLYDVVFALAPEGKAQADAALAESGLWHRIHARLCSLTVLDPACGSGSFLVGMLCVLDDLLARANRQMGRQQTPYERKRRIISRNLYGVDVKDWAVRIAELRLWFQLIVDAGPEPAQFQASPQPPSLSYTLRCGDSLVQEIGGLDMARSPARQSIPLQLKGRISQFKAEKVKFHHNDPDCRYRSTQDVQNAEAQLFRDMLEARTQTIDERIQHIERMLRPRVNLFDETPSPQFGPKRASLERELACWQAERDQTIQLRHALQTGNDAPFVWDIAFAEVFAGERSGYDIVIGNPPYVRHELIYDPRQPVDEATPRDRRAYKARLARSVYAAWPQTFDYDWRKDKPRWKLSAKSDLYIYFCLHGLSLLNEAGSFCFLTSNSWLDVGYGRDLQEFLLTRGQIKLIIDNQARRSFVSADVNTTIMLLGAAQDAKTPLLRSAENQARFVMLNIPFEAALSAMIWNEIEQAGNRHTSSEVRVVPLKQAELLNNGIDPKRKTYAGAKWGGRYLRAPDIASTVFEKGRDKLVKLAEIIRVETYLNTGGADGFFIVRPANRAPHTDTVAILTSTDQVFEIEAEYVRPFIKSPSEINRVVVHKEHAGWLLVAPPEQLDRGSAAWRYIRWGEQQGYHRRSGCRKRSPWWRLPRQATEPGDVLWSRLHHARHLVVHNPERISYTNFYALHSDKPLPAAAMLNTSFFAFVKELMGKANFGGGALKTDGNDIKRFPCIDSSALNPEDEQRLVSAFNQIAAREVEPVPLEIQKPDRQRLDAVIFDLLGLTPGERDAVYEGLVALIDRRSAKAKSL